jgi:hypothetical protein
MTIEGVVSRRNIRARALELQHRLGTAAAAVYRTVTPQRLRAARRDWLNARTRDQMRRATGLLTPLSALPESMDWAVRSVETAIVIVVGLS